MVQFRQYNHIDVDNKRIIKLADPVDSNDAVTLDYLNTAFASFTAGISEVQDSEAGNIFTNITKLNFGVGLTVISSGLNRVTINSDASQPMTGYTFSPIASFSLPIDTRSVLSSSATGSPEVILIDTVDLTVAGAVPVGATFVQIRIKLKASATGNNNISLMIRENIATVTSEVNPKLTLTLTQAYGLGFWETLPEDAAWIDDEYMTCIVPFDQLSSTFAIKIIDDRNDLDSTGTDLVETEIYIEGYWLSESATVTFGSIALNDLTDVDTFVSPPAIGDSLVYNGSIWVPSTPVVGSTIIVEDNNAGGIPVSTINFGNGLTVTNDGSGQATINSLGAIVGEIRMFGGSVAPSGWFLCNGDTVSQTTYSALFGVIGTAYSTGGEAPGDFRLPNSKGRVCVGAGIQAGLTTRAIGDTGGEEEVPLSIAQLPSHSHSGTTTIAAGHVHSGSSSTAGAHTHTGTANTAGSHNHSVPLNAAGSGSNPSYDNFADSSGGDISTSAAGNHTHVLTINASSDHTHLITINSAGSHDHTFSTSSVGSGATHENMPPFFVANYIIYHGV